MNSAMPPLVDSHGRPLRRVELDQDVAGPSLIRTISSNHPSSGLDPQRLANILLAAESGDAEAYLELAEDMEEKDLHYLGVMGTRKRAVSQLPVDVIAAGDDPEAEGDAQLVRDWLERDTLEAELFDMLDAIGKGFSVTEIIWEQTPEAWLPIRLEHRDPRWFRFDQTDGSTLLLKDGGVGRALGAAKFITHVHPAKSGLPIRSGLARPVAWAYMFRNYSMKDWVTFSDAYGLPLRIGRYENGATEANIRLLMSAIGRLGSDAAAVFPKSMDVAFQDGKSGDTGELFERLCVYLEQQISKAVLGQTATTDAVAGGLGAGQANTHNDVRRDIQRADARLLSTTLNRDLVPWLVSFNRGKRARYPRLRLGRPDPLDIKTLTDAVQVLVPLGMKVGMATIRDRMGLPAPRDGEELLVAPGSVAASPAQQAIASSQTPVADFEIVDVEEEALGGWRRLPA